MHPRSDSSADAAAAGARRFPPSRRCNAVKPSWRVHGENRRAGDGPNSTNPLKEKDMASPVDSSIAAMQQAAADSARLQAASITVQTQIQGATTSAQTVNAASAAATETAKGVAGDTKAAARAS